jgi:hypothetical protein
MHITYFGERVANVQHEEPPESTAYRLGFLPVLWFLALVRVGATRQGTACRSVVFKMQLGPVVPSDGDIGRFYLRIAPQSELERLSQRGAQGLRRWLRIFGPVECQV